MYKGKIDLFFFHPTEFIARQEYRAIKRRLQRGKKIGAKLGKWTNGKPPFPYIYNRETKTLEIDEKNLQIYELIKKRFLALSNQ